MYSAVISLKDVLVLDRQTLCVGTESGRNRRWETVKGVGARDRVRDRRGECEGVRVGEQVKTRGKPKPCRDISFGCFRLHKISNVWLVMFLMAHMALFL